MRACLNPLIGLGRKYGLTFIIVSIPTSKVGLWGRKRNIADSADIWDIARSVLIAGETNDGRYISQEKAITVHRPRPVLFR